MTCNKSNIGHSELHDITYYDVSNINNHIMKKKMTPTLQPSRVLCVFMYWLTASSVLKPAYIVQITIPCRFIT